MRFLSLVGLYQKSPSTAGSIGSGVYWNTAPTDCPPLGSLAMEDGNVFQLVRLSGTCTVGALVYLTGTQPYGTGNTAPMVMAGSGTGLRPEGVAMISPTASGAWTWVQVYGKCTSIQITNTFSIAAGNAAMYAWGGSAAVNASTVVTAIASGTAGLYSCPAFYLGQSLTAATDSQCLGFIALL